ncbi:MAG: ATP-dependent Clp protease adaptor ClpS [Candidatus Sericytochromatia bacterium]|nr:ATP-dependent Clp protease adaptor ClpS [Candidatus Sericytochromatia bacterium]
MPVPVETPQHTVASRMTVQWLPPYVVIVHDNDWNTFEEVTGILLRAVPELTAAEALELTREIHATGSAVVFRGDTVMADACARVIRTIGIRVTIEAAN